MPMSPQENDSLILSLARLSESSRNEVIQQLSDGQCAELLYDWKSHARQNQLRPGGDWRFWLLLAGRGFGKTRTGAETVRAWVDEGYRRIHIIGPTASDTRNVMVQGPSGLLSCFPPDQRPNYEPAKHMITFHTGAVAETFSADEPERLRGPQCEAFWADECCSWRFLADAWDNLMFGFRIGADPRGVISTTPKPSKWLTALVKNPSTVITRGSSYDNRAFLASAFFTEILSKYEGTRLGRQEILAEILEDVPGALWTRAMIEASRCAMPLQLVRVVVAIDPAVSANEGSDETGIGAVGLDDRGHCYVLEDASMRGSPADWGVRAARLMAKWHADRIVAEVNNGGDLVEANIRAIPKVGHMIPYKAVRATRGKMTRAEPVAALYEQGRVHHVGTGLEMLEDQLCAYVPGTGQKSPDRLDWLVWAVTELVLQPLGDQIVTYDARRTISPI